MWPASRATRSRGAIRDVGKALGLPFGELERLARLSDSWDARQIGEELKRLHQIVNALLAVDPPHPDDVELFLLRRNAVGGLDVHSVWDASDFGGQKTLFEGRRLQQRLDDHQPLVAAPAQCRQCNPLAQTIVQRSNPGRLHVHPGSENHLAQGGRLHLQDDDLESCL